MNNEDKRQITQQEQLTYCFRYLAENPDSFTKSEFDFLWGIIEWANGKGITPKQVSAFITTVKTVERGEERFLARCIKLINK